MKRLMMVAVLVLMVLPVLGLTSHTVSAQAAPVTSSNSYAQLPDPFNTDGQIKKAAVPQNITPRTIQLGAPIDFPKDLDQLYQFIEEGHRGYVFTACKAGQITGAYLTWDMVKTLMPAMADDHNQALILLSASDIAQAVAVGGGKFPTTGSLNVTENAVFGKIVMLSAQGQFAACSINGDGKPTLYGPGAQMFLDWLAGYLQ